MGVVPSAGGEARSVIGADAAFVAGAAIGKCRWDMASDHGKLDAVPMPHRLLIVAHGPSQNTRRLRDAVLRGATSPEFGAGFGTVEARLLPPLEAGPDDVLAAQAIVLGTTENLGYMSGALKDFFDRVYYPCLERTQGMPYALFIRAKHDGTGTGRAGVRMARGLRGRAVQEPLLGRGEFREDFVTACEELGQLMAAGLDAGIF